MNTASEKIRAYHHELTKKKVKTLAYGAFVFFTTLFLVMLCSGDRFNRYLAFFGLSGISNREGGVYADCSLPENSDVAYCRSKISPQESNWNKLKDGGSAPFSLHGD
jgi:hypothetical protein